MSTETQAALLQDLTSLLEKHRQEARTGMPAEILANFLVRQINELAMVVSQAKPKGPKPPYPGPDGFEVDNEVLAEALDFPEADIKARPGEYHPAPTSMLETGDGELVTFGDADLEAMDIDDEEIVRNGEVTTARRLREEGMDDLAETPALGH